MRTGLPALSLHLRYRCYHHNLFYIFDPPDHCSSSPQLLTSLSYLCRDLHDLSCHALVVGSDVDVLCLRASNIARYMDAHRSALPFVRKLLSLGEDEIDVPFVAASATVTPSSVSPIGMERNGIEEIKHSLHISYRCVCVCIYIYMCVCVGRKGSYE